MAMGEMTYEQPPVVDVPVIRDWYSGAFDGLNRLLWGRRSSFFFWGPLFLIWACWQFVKVVAWVAGIAVITTLFMLTSVLDLITYRKRQERASQAAWTAYMLALHERDYPDDSCPSGAG
jgi:hypothetical protein